MIKIFITAIHSELQVEKATALHTKDFQGLQIETDLERSNLPFPCGHSILRVEGDFFSQKL